MKTDSTDSSKDMGRTKDSKQLADEVYRKIDDVDRHLNKMERRLTPGQLIDDFVFYPRGGNIRSTFEHLKANPIGTSFLTLGTVLLSDYNGNTVEQTASREISSRAHQVSQKASETAGQIREKREKVMSKVRESRDLVSESIRNKKQEFSDRRHQKRLEKETESYREIEASGSIFSEDVSEKSPMDSAKERVGELRSDVKAKASEAREQIREKSSAAREQIREKVDAAKQNPYAFVALGLSLGAITGAAVPLSEKEEKLIGQRFSGTLDSFTDDLTQTLKRSADAMKDEILGDIGRFSFTERGQGTQQTSQSY